MFRFSFPPFFSVRRLSYLRSSGFGVDDEVHGKSSSTLSFIQSVTPGEYIEEFSFTVHPRNLTKKG